MNGLLHDFRYALRQMRKSPLFTAVGVITLALAIGANTAIFSVVHQVLLQPLPYPHSERLAAIWGSNPSRGEQSLPISPGDFADWKSKNDVFEDIAASYDNQVTLTGRGDPRLLLGYDFSPNYFKILGVAPKIGRTFTEDEAHKGASVAVLSDKLWRSTFDADRQILGRAITLDARSYVVIGVMPPDFDFPPRTELWMPLNLSPAAASDYENRYIRVMGRLKPGVSVKAAQLRMDARERQIAAEHPQTDSGDVTWVEPLRDQLAGDIRRPLLALLGAVGFVLLIACVNIAGLVLARAADRRMELSVRLAIGATRTRLLQQYLSEGLLLSIVGGAVGVLLAFGCARFLVAIFPNNIANLNIPRIEAIPINGPALWFALGITLLAALAFSAVPALQSSKIHAGDAMKESGRNVASGLRVARVRCALVISEIALSLLLLTGAGLMIESFRRVCGENLGIRTENTLAIEVFLPPNKYPSDQPQKRDGFVRGVIEGLRRVPGVQSAAAINFLPLTGFWGTTDFAVEGQATANPSDKPKADNRLITPDYFSTMGMALLRGRCFTDADRTGSQQVAIVNSTFAHRYFGAGDPIGKVLEISGGGPQRWVVIGEVPDVRAFGPEEPAHADLYRPLAQVSFPLLAFTVRTSGDASSALNSAKQAVWNVDKDQPIFDAMPLSLLAAQSVTLRRVSAILLGGFSSLALGLAALGLYGLMAYSVTQRTHEIGIRVALGAGHGDVLLEMLGSGMRLVLVGVAVGFTAALIVARLGSSLLYQVSPGDPLILAGAGGILMTVALIAISIPARRAAKVDPMVALRYE